MTDRYPPHVSRRNRRIADRVYMRRIGIDVPHADEFDDLIDAGELDDKHTGFQQHAWPERGTNDE
jgi:hypothetical protein